MKRKLLVTFVLCVVLSSILTVGVLAQGGPRTNERRERIVPLGSGLDAGISAIYRSGWTNTWNDGFWVGSNHYSHSDLQEDTISVSGRLSRMGQQLTTCDRVRHGTNHADCPCPSVENPFGTQVFLAQSHHTFHTAGYVDSAFDTWEQRFA